MTQVEALQHAAAALSALAGLGHDEAAEAQGVIEHMWATKIRDRARRRRKASHD